MLLSWLKVLMTLTLEKLKKDKTENMVNLGLLKKAPLQLELCCYLHFFDSFHKQARILTTSNKIALERCTLSSHGMH